MFGCFRVTTTQVPKKVAVAQVMVFTGLGDHTWQMTRLPSQQLAKAFFYFRFVSKKMFTADGNPEKRYRVSLEVRLLFY